MHVAIATYQILRLTTKLKLNTAAQEGTQVWGPQKFNRWQKSNFYGEVIKPGGHGPLGPNSHTYELYVAYILLKQNDTSYIATL